MVGISDKKDRLEPTLEQSLPDAGSRRKMAPGILVALRTPGQICAAMPLLSVTYIGGPTALLEVGPLRLLTDPTFDPAGTEHHLPAYILRKTMGPALTADQVGRVDAVLLSHEHHADNIDAAGRAMLRTVPRVLTTRAGAERLGGGAVGLAAWEQTDLPSADGRVLRVTATPCRHGPAHLDRGPVIGFALAWRDAPDEVVYVSGDTVWYEGVAEVARRFHPRAALLFMGAARVAAVVPWPLTMTAGEAVEAARALAGAVIVPLHFEGWEHFSESREDIAAGFDRAGLADRLRWPVPGRTIAVA
jgi:L-ascorbate metabolism protein UlaG (beta-lactamase superfamily)